MGQFRRLLFYAINALRLSSNDEGGGTDDRSDCSHYDARRYRLCHTPVHTFRLRSLTQIGYSSVEQYQTQPLYVCGVQSRSSETQLTWNHQKRGLGDIRITFSFVTDPIFLSLNTSRRVSNPPGYQWPCLRCGIKRISSLMIFGRCSLTCPEPSVGGGIYNIAYEMRGHELGVQQC